jgi:Domain of unknown function (DUF222)/HNH endonuclease
MFDELAACSDSDLTDSLGQLVGGMAAVHRVVLELVRHCEERQVWKDDGMPSMADWLSARFGLRYANAREWVRVANALDELPECAQAFGEGRLSWDQLRPLTEFATRESDHLYAAETPGVSVACVEAEARRARRISRGQAEDEHRERYLRWWWPSDGGLRLSGLLPAADGAVVTAALDRIVEQAAADGDGQPEDSMAARSADALFALASTRLAEDADADRACVVVHADAAALAGGEGGASLDSGGALNSEVLRRLACDARLELVVHGPSGTPLGVGRARRTVPAWMLRLLRRRDRGCRWPGCGRRRWLHAHHLVQWVDGGPTDMDNLALICSHHHHLLHELGWSVSGDPNGELRFWRPDGRALNTGPPGLRPEVRGQLAGAIHSPLPLAS